MKKIFAACLSLSLLLAASQSPVFAVGSGALGNITGTSPRAMGTGYAFAGIADDASAIYFNPGGLTQVKGTEMILGATVLSMKSKHTTPDGQADKMADNTPFIPLAYFSYSGKDSPWAYGVGINSPFGLITEWKDDSFSKYYATKSKLLMYNINPTVGYAVNEKISVGAGIDYFNLFDAELNSKVSSLGAEPDGNSKLTGDGTGWGYNFGMLYKLNEKHSFGASYRSQVNVIVEGSLELSNLQGTASALFGGGSSYTSDITTEFKFPQSILLGYGFKPSEKLELTVDYDWVDWSCVKETNFNFANDNPFLTHTVDRDWKATNNIGGGAEWHAKDWLDLRGGLVIYERVIPSGTLEASLPDSSRWGITLGSGFKLGNSVVDIGYNGSFFKKRSISNSSNDTLLYSADGDFKTQVHAISVSLTQKWGGQ